MIKEDKRVSGGQKPVTEKKNISNLRKARKAPRHRYDDTPYRDRADELHKAFRKYMLREEASV